VAAAYTTHNRKTCMPSAGLEPEIPGIEWPQAYDLERTATGIGL